MPKRRKTQTKSKMPKRGHKIQKDQLKEVTGGKKRMGVKLPTLNKREDDL